MDSEETLAEATQASQTIAETKTETQSEKTAEKPAEAYKVFASKDDFDHHAAGIMNNARNKAEKEILALLGLKPDEKDKLAKFKDAYDATLSEAEKSALHVTELEREVAAMKSALSEKDAVIAALSKLSGKTTDDVDKFVKMARGLVDDNTSIDDALEQVFAITGVNKKETEAKKITSSPLNPQTDIKVDKNPFVRGAEYNLTQQGILKRQDIAHARELYLAANGSLPAW